MACCVLIALIIATIRQRMSRRRRPEWREVRSQRATQGLESDDQRDGTDRSTAHRSRI